MPPRTRSQGAIAVSSRSSTSAATSHPLPVPTTTRQQRSRSRTQSSVQRSRSRTQSSVPSTGVCTSEEEDKAPSRVSTTRGKKRRRAAQDSPAASPPPDEERFRDFTVVVEESGPSTLPTSQNTEPPRSPSPDVVVLPDKISLVPPPAKPEALAAYSCPVCFCAPSKATMTPCGHVLCGEVRRPPLFLARALTWPCVSACSRLLKPRFVGRNLGLRGVSLGMSLMWSHERSVDADQVPCLSCGDTWLGW